MSRNPAATGQKLVLRMLKSEKAIRITSELTNRIDALRSGIIERVDGRKKMKNWGMNANSTRPGALRSYTLYSLLPIHALPNPRTNPMITAGTRTINGQL